MSERPILMSGPLVRSVLDGHKTQTRRLMTPQPVRCPEDDIGQVYPALVWDRPGGPVRLHAHSTAAAVWCPYGAPGDRLWVREAWTCLSGKARPGEPLAYRADTTDGERVRVDAPWRPSIHMPRWASRLTLEVTGVRVERLQDISEEDARAEGVVPDETERCRGGFGGGQHTSRVSRTEVLSCPLCAGTGYQPNAYRDAFRALWNQINAERATWESNPWVWVITFTRATS